MTPLHALVKWGSRFNWRIIGIVAGYIVLTLAVAWLVWGATVWHNAAGPNGPNNRDAGIYGASLLGAAWLMLTGAGVNAGTKRIWAWEERQVKAREARRVDWRPGWQPLVDHRRPDSANQVCCCYGRGECLQPADWDWVTPEPGQLSRVPYCDEHFRACNIAAPDLFHLRGAAS